MTLPAKREEGAEHWLGTASLELVRARIHQAILANPEVSSGDYRRIFKELDALIAYEHDRRALSGKYAKECAALEHRISQLKRAAEATAELQGIRIASEYELDRHRRNRVQWQLDVAERILALRAKYRKVAKPNPHLEEMLRLKRQQQVTEAREQAMLESIRRRARHRATFVKMVNEKFPDMAEDMIDFYDQQIFRQTKRR